MNEYGTSWSHGDQATADPPAMLAVPASGNFGTRDKPLSTSTMRCIRQDWIEFLEWSATQSSNDPPVDLIIGFVRSQRERGSSFSLVRRRVYSACAVYDYNGHRVSRRVYDALGAVYKESAWRPEVRRDPRPVTCAELRRVLRTASIRDTAMLWVLYDGLMLSQELCCLNCDDVAVDSASVRLHVASLRTGWKARTLIMGEEATRAIRAWLDNRPQATPLFVSLKRKAKPRRLLNQDVRLILNRRCEQAGVRHLSPTEVVLGGIELRQTRGENIWSTYRRMGRIAESLASRVTNPDYIDVDQISSDMARTMNEFFVQRARQLDSSQASPLRCGRRRRAQGFASRRRLPLPRNRIR